jgi:very-short-patch-repair endonuclease
MSEIESKKTGKNINCDNCSKEFYVSVGRLNRGSKNNYCSIGCKKKHQGSSIEKCANCTKDVEVKKSRVEKSKNIFCNKVCHDQYQSRNKVSFNCVVCKKEFKTSPSYLVKADKRNHTIQYCSIQCRDNDKERMTEKAQNMNSIQLNKKGLNKLEMAGREFLQNLGYKLNIDFKEQVLLFDKFCVDAVCEEMKLVIQFDGEYWHTNPKRKKLDDSQDSYLTKAGYKVFRITDKEMYSKDEATHGKIIERLVRLVVSEAVNFKMLKLN